MNQFQLSAPFSPTGDQPQAIEKLVKNIKAGVKHQVLLGVTGSGKTFTVANVILKTGLPALVIEPNKTLAAQVYQELKELFPKNGVHYFVSYYDYYQPEAYIPQTNTYIEKDAKINDVIDQLRHAATADVLSRKDVIVVASVSCIYGLGDPEIYKDICLDLSVGAALSRRDIISHLINLQYTRDDYNPRRSAFRVRGDTIEIWLPYGTEKITLLLKNKTLQKIGITHLAFKDPDPRVSPKGMRHIKIFPAKHFVTPDAKLKLATQNVRTELSERLETLKKSGKAIEAQRLEQRTNYDLELLEESGYCSGIENYSRHLSFRKPGQAPYTLIDYFPKDFITVIDESHMTVPQLRAMAEGDRKRKEVLVQFGFRLPSAIDNRPLTLQEFEQKTNQTIYVSATPGVYEKGRAGPKNIIEQLIRPTGILDPKIEVTPTENQVKDLIKEINARVAKKERTLVLAFTKRLAEDLAEYLTRNGIKVHWLHSEVKTLLRPELLKDLRTGKVDVVVGVNLLREGLDLPEVSLVAILDADKEGFLRNETTLIQAMGRAARHIDGCAILYADKITLSMRAAIKEVTRRRSIQKKYNEEHKITPEPIIKDIRSWQAYESKVAKIEFGPIQDIKLLEREMKKAARNLDFERAAEIRDIIAGLRMNHKKFERHNA